MDPYWAVSNAPAGLSVDQPLPSMVDRIRWRVNLAIALSSLAIVIGSIWFYQSIVRPRTISEEIRVLIDSMERQSPPGMSRRQWNSAVAWTHNLHGYCMISFHCDAATLDNFRDRLTERLRGPVDMTTIHWIWDQYVLLSGGRYQNYRAVMLEVEDFDDGHRA